MANHGGEYCIFCFNNKYTSACNCENLTLPECLEIKRKYLADQLKRNEEYRQWLVREIRPLVLGTH